MVPGEDVGDECDNSANESAMSDKDDDDATPIANPVPEHTNQIYPENLRDSQTIIWA